jgi:hypothetical protein
VLEAGVEQNRIRPAESIILITGQGRRPIDVQSSQRRLLEVKRDRAAATE